MQTLKGEMAVEGMSRTGSNLKHWSISAVLMVCVVLAFFDKISIAVLFSDPSFQTAMGIGGDKTALGWLMTSFLLAYGFSSIFLSVAGDLVNPKKCLTACVVLWGLLMALMGMAKSYEQMLVLRVLLGIAEGPLFALAYTIVKQCYQPHQIARASTMFLLGTPIGAALGFPITAYVLANFGWQMTFFVMAGLTLLVVLVVVAGLRDVVLKTGAELNAGKRMGWQQHLENCKVLFGAPAFWAVCLFNTALLTYLWGLNGWLPSYLIEAKGINLKEFGSLSSLPFIAMLIGEVAGAFLSDKTGKRAAQVFAGLLVAGIAMAAVPQIESPMLTILAMSVSAMSWGFGVASVFALLARVSPDNVSATAGGVFNGFGNFAGAAAPVIMGYIVTRSGSFDNGIMFLVVIAIVGSLVLLPLVRKY
ncbi:MFS transporter [Marinobacterium aestuariivivens]|uniref:MFS transporter n=1 Tax=Marinobacterium aestuariivivens TaxID=1698799 RepID=A0ABW1ZXG6_9GAMM